MFNYSKDHFEIYDFQFKFLPMIFNYYEKTKKSPGINIDDSKLIDIQFLKEQYKTNFMDWSKFKFEIKQISDKIKEFIYDFGEPKEAPLCHYGIFYVNEENNLFEYFTLEKTLSLGLKNNDYMVCGQKNSQHNNYGIKCQGKFEIFQKIVDKIITDRLKPTGGFNSEKMELSI